MAFADAATGCCPGGFVAVQQLTMRLVFKSSSRAPAEWHLPPEW
jgi:hypothetical protein